MTTIQMRKVATGIMTACLGFGASLAEAQDAGSRPAREYVQAAASSDQFEILAGEAALAQSKDPDVRAFAARMIQDHQRLGRAVRDAATQSGLKPPEMAMSADQAQWLGALQSVNGKDFDSLYLKQQMLAHHSALAVERMYANTGGDQGLRQLAASASSLIASHGEMAGQVATKLGQ